MPVFEYHCLSCKNDFEFMKICSSETPACPKCNETDKLQKLLSSGIALKFIGPGFHATDYKVKDRDGGTKREAIV